MIRTVSYNDDFEQFNAAQEALWADRVLPEEDWDESEEALVVEGIVGESRMHDYAS